MGTQSLIFESRRYTKTETVTELKQIQKVSDRIIVCNMWSNSRSINVLLNVSVKGSLVKYIVAAKF